MKILVTGGAGFVGSSLVRRLLKKGHKVDVVDNLWVGLESNVPPEAHLFKWDICCPETPAVLAKMEPDVIFHLAAQTMLRESISDPMFDARTNVVGTINVLEGAVRAGVQQFVYTSTGGARYGEPKYLPVDENHPCNPCSPYGISKYMAEKYVQFYHDTKELNCVIFCFGNVYGPFDNPCTGRLIPSFVDKALRGETPHIYGDGGAKRDFIYVGDLVDFLSEIIGKDTPSLVYNLASERETSVIQVYNTLKALIHEMPQVVFDKKVKGEIHRIVLDCSKARTELGWSPSVSLLHGLKNTLTWFRTVADQRQVSVE